MRPVGEGHPGALGNGCVDLVAAHLVAVSSQKKTQVVNVVCDGDTMRHLAARWQAHVLDLAPDWLSIMIGINDVWR
jgi:lysophospholipase L1-like esterase